MYINFRNTILGTKMSTILWGSFINPKKQLRSANYLQCAIQHNVKNDKDS